MAYVSMADPDSAKWEQDLKAGIASGPIKTKQVSWGTLTVHTGPFRLASFHKAFDDWFQQEGLLGLFADDGKLLNGRTYGALKNYDKKKHPAIRYALMLWGDQFGKDGPDHKIDTSGIVTADDMNDASRRLLRGVVDELEALPELLSFAGDLFSEDFASWDLSKLKDEWTDHSWVTAANSHDWLTAGGSDFPHAEDAKARICVKATWTGVGVADVASDLSKGVGGVKLSIDCMGKRLESAPVVSWSSARPMSDGPAIKRDLDAAAPDFRRSAVDLLAQLRRELSGHLSLLKVFKGNLNAYLAKAKELPAFNALSWIAVVSHGEVRLLANPARGGRKIADALAVYKIDHPAHFAWRASDGHELSTGDNPKTSITADKLDPDFKLVAARGDDCDWTEYGHWHRYHWTDYVAEGASDAILRALGIDAAPWKRPFGAGTDDNEVESGSFKGGFALKSYRSGECDSGD